MISCRRFRVLTTFLRSIFTLAPLTTSVILLGAAGWTRCAADDAEPAVEADAVHVSWITDVAQAKELARKEKKDLLLFFTGSDWCGFCMQLEKAVLLQSEFSNHITPRFVPVLLDFPNSKEQPEELKKQNTELKDLLGVTGFPTVYLVTPDVLPFGKVGGFGGKKSFWETLEKGEQQGAKLRAIAGETPIPDIADPVVLDRVLAAVPVDLVRSGWLPQLEREVAISKAGHPDLNTKWSNAIVEIENTMADEKFVAKAGASLRRAMQSAATEQDVLAFFDQLAAETEGRPVRLRFFLIQKMRYLQDRHRFEESLALATQLRQADWANASDQGIAKTIQRRLLFSMGRIDEGLALVNDLVNSREFESEAEREQMRQYFTAVELGYSGQHTLALERLSKLSAELPADSKLNSAIATLADNTCALTGRDHEWRGKLLLASSDAAMAPEQASIRNQKAALAAVCFKAAGRDDLARPALERVKTEGAQGPSRLAPALIGYSLPPHASVEDLVTVARGSVGDALTYLGDHSTSIGQGVYLMEAALAMRKENRPAEANSLSERGRQSLTDATAGDMVDTQTLERLKELVKAWDADASATKSSAP